MNGSCLPPFISCVIFWNVQDEISIILICKISWNAAKGVKGLPRFQLQDAIGFIPV